MSDNRYIGVFDSGIGGLTVVKSIVECMPGENIIYFGDTAHVPYGTRSKRQITEYVLADVRFLRTFDIKAVVIACNTADSVAKEKVREVNPDLPVFGVVDPASRLAAVSTKNGRIGPVGGRMPFLASRGGSMWKLSLFGGRLNCTPRRECWQTMLLITTSRMP